MKIYTSVILHFKGIRSMKLIIPILFTIIIPVIAQKPVALMPNAVAICVEGCTITKLPLGTSIQLGVGNTYTPAVTTTASAPKIPLFIYYSSFAFDPAPNILKTFYVQQQTSAYSVTYILSGSTTPIVMNVSALSPPVATTSTPTSINIPYNGTCSTSIDPSTNSLIINLSVSK